MAPQARRGAGLALLVAAGRRPAIPRRAAIDAEKRSLAEIETGKVGEKEEEPFETVFESGGLSLQALNPEGNTRIMLMQRGNQGKQTFLWKHLE
jgi:hypothetical protein